MLDQYLEELKEELNKREADDREGFLQYIEEIISDRMENGESEEEILSSLGPAEKFIDGIYEKKEQMEENVRSRETKTISLDHISDINIDVETFDIRIRSCEEEKGRLEYDSVNEMGLNIVVDEDELSIEQDNSASSFSGLFGRLFRNDSVSFEGTITIYLPKQQKTDLELHNLSGDVEIFDLNFNDVEIETVSGDVSLRNVRADEIELKTVSGDIRMEEVSAEEEVQIETVSGNVDGHFVHGEEIDVNTVSGDIHLMVDGNREDYSIEENRVNHHSSYNGKGSRELRINTVSGNIRYHFSK